MTHALKIGTMTSLFPKEDQDRVGVAIISDRLIEALGDTVLIRDKTGNVVKVTIDDKPGLPVKPKIFKYDGIRIAIPTFIIENHVEDNDSLAKHVLLIINIISGDVTKEYIDGRTARNLLTCNVVQDLDALVVIITNDE